VRRLAEEHGIRAWAGPPAPLKGVCKEDFVDPAPLPDRDQGRRMLTSLEQRRTRYFNGHPFVAQELTRAGVRFRKANSLPGVTDVDVLQASRDRVSPTLLERRSAYWEPTLVPTRPARTRRYGLTPRSARLGLPLVKLRLRLLGALSHVPCHPAPIDCLSATTRSTQHPTRSAPRSTSSGLHAGSNRQRKPAANSTGAATGVGRRHLEGVVRCMCEPVVGFCNSEMMLVL
jgi:hypothetical protein